MYFIKAKDIVLSTAYESKETAENVVSEMKKIKALKEYTFEIVEKEIDTSKRGHKNTINEDIVKEADRLYHSLKSLEYKRKRKNVEDTLDNSLDVINKKAIHGSAWRDYMLDKDGICPKDEQRYLYRFKVSKQPTLREVIRFTGLNIKQVYILQQKTKLYPVPRVNKDAANKYAKYVDETGDSLGTGYDIMDEGGLEEYSLAI